MNFDSDAIDVMANAFFFLAVAFASFFSLIWNMPEKSNHWGSQPLKSMPCVALISSRYLKFVKNSRMMKYVRKIFEKCNIIT